MRGITVFLLSLAVLLPSAAADLSPVPPADADVFGLLERVHELAPEARGVRTIVGFHEMPDVSGGLYAGQRVLDLSEGLRFVTVDVTEQAAFEAYVGQDEDVAYWEVETLYRASYTPNDPFWQQSDYTWGQWEIWADVAWDRTRGTTSTKLCVIDTGLYKGHEEFSGQTRVAQGYDFVYEDSDPNDPNGHGTHVAGIASATIDNAKGIPGMAKVTLIPIRVLDAAGNGYPTDIAQGIDYCRTQGGHFASMSLGGGASTTIQNAVVAYQNAGGLAIAATGNSGCACVEYPAGYSGVLGVGAVDKTLAKASFSNTGSHVDIVAPGVSIVSSWKTISGCTTNCYIYSDGTSMATPFVSGTAALVKSYSPSMTASQISSRLTGTAQDLGASGWDSSFGYGLLRADQAVV